MAAQRADLDHQFVAFLEQADLAFGCERDLKTNFVIAVGGFNESKRCLRPSDGRGILLAIVEAVRKFLEPLTAQDFVSEQRDAANWYGSEVAVNFLQDAALRKMPLLEITVGDFCRQDAVDDHAVHSEAMQREVYERALGLAQHHAFRVGDQAHARDPW